MTSRKLDDLAHPRADLPPSLPLRGPGLAAGLAGRTEGRKDRQLRQRLDRAFLEQAAAHDDELDEDDDMDLSSVIDDDDDEDDLLRPKAERTEEDLLQELASLHQELASLRSRPPEDEGEDDGAGGESEPVRTYVGESNKVIVCAVRRPVTMHLSTWGEGWEYTRSRATVMQAMDIVGKHNRVHWVCWPGVAVEEASQEGVKRKLETDFSTSPVFLTSEMGDLFLDKFCGQTLWQMLHSIPPAVDLDMLDTFQESFDAYCAANQRYYEVVTEIYEPGDLVLVYDYHLMLLPMLLRTRFPDITCSFTLTCPFPSTEFFRMSPVRQELLRGMIGADLVTFSDFDYVRHFVNSLIRILGIESALNQVESPS